MLLLLARIAAAGTPMVLPPGANPGDWQVPLALAGLSIGSAAGTPHATLSAEGRLCAVLPPDQRRCVSIDPPQTDADREAAAWLAVSLLREVQAAPPPEPVVVAAPPRPTPTPPAPEPTPEPTPEPVVPEPEPVLPAPAPRVPVALSPIVQWRADAGLALGGSLHVCLPTEQRLQPLARLLAVGPEQIALSDGRSRQTHHLGIAAGARWQPVVGPTASLVGGLSWQRWLEEGDPVASALLPVVTARAGYRLGSGTVTVQPWLGLTAALRTVSMTIDGEPAGTASPLSARLGLSIER